MTHWLYPTNASGDYYLIDPVTDEHLPVSAGNVLRFIEAAPGQVDPWGLSQGYRSMEAGDLLWLYAAGVGELYAVGTVDDVRLDEDGYWYADVLWSAEDTRRLMDAPIPRARFGQVVRAPVRANETTTALLDEWLDRGPEQSTDGNERPGQSQRPDRVRRDIALRRGQPAFRAKLLAAYERKCAVTGEAVEDVLEAAHIDPYSESGCNDLGNGLLLRADVHTLFDLHLLAVDPAGRLEVSPKLRGTSYAALAGVLLTVPRDPSAKPDSSRLAEHRRAFSSD
ncbi:HNH endonuclease [Geodermatophilus sp. DSM 45219]|uniref:HNH endonuclease n=1 Tax=Geodermatophilus sp. DSM 45219 TaxID=1881103 RepID=UPI000B8522AD|nr:HNH endonuclease [Geodermatophilus sp. DSM 45219]